MLLGLLFFSLLLVLLLLFLFSCDADLLNAGPGLLQSLVALLLHSLPLRARMLELGGEHLLQFLLERIEVLRGCGSHLLDDPADRESGLLLHSSLLFGLFLLPCLILQLQGLRLGPGLRLLLRALHVFYSLPLLLLVLSSHVLDHLLLLLQRLPSVLLLLFSPLLLLVLLLLLLLPAAAAAATEERDDDAEAEADSDNEEDADGETQLDPAAFRLTGPEVSGTSEESCSESEEACQDPEEMADSDGRTWRERLSALHSEVVWVSAATGSRAPPPAQSREQAGAGVEERDLAELCAACSDCCAEVEAAAKQGEKGIFQDTLEAALHTLVQKLPSLVRHRTSKALRLQLLQLEAGPHKAREVELFAWTSAEEFAWARYVWRLIRSAAPEFRYTSFVHRWGEAAREPQRRMLAEAKSHVSQQTKEVLVNENRVAVEEAIKGWASAHAQRNPARLVAKLRPLAGVMNSHIVCWCRPRWWDDQRKLRRLKAPHQHGLEPKLVRHFAVYMATEVNTAMGLNVPVDMLQLLVKEQLGFAPSAVKVQNPLLRMSLKLPSAISLIVFNKCVDCTLKSVTSLEELVVIVGTGASARVCRSLEETARTIFARERQRQGKPPEWPAQELRILETTHGAWSIFLFGKVHGQGHKKYSLAWQVNLSAARKVPAFINPRGTLPCPVLPAVNFVKKTRAVAAPQDVALAPLASVEGSRIATTATATGRGKGRGRGRGRAAGQSRGRGRGADAVAVAASAGTGGAGAATAQGAAASAAAAFGGGGPLPVGTQVKYLQNDLWWRGTVKEDRGKDVVVMNHATGAKVAQIVRRDRVAPFTKTTVGERRKVASLAAAEAAGASASSGGAGKESSSVIAVEDSD
mmetsp:Transcript_25513/g.82165  ORF Transcript_25513/g.82165 Transcript_25513/m.82165 type:complete len:863 (-) Transcript_25513:74-2662(-)